MNLSLRLDAHRPLCLLAPAILGSGGKTLRDEIRRIADAGFGGVCAPFAPEVGAETWRALDDACAECALEWHLQIVVSGQSPALVSVVRDVAAGGAAGVWASLQQERDWVVARAVPLDERGAVWNRALDLLHFSQQLAGWNGRARIFAFAPEMQNGFWPSRSAAQEIEDGCASVASAFPNSKRNAAAWRSLVVQSQDAAPPAFPFFNSSQNEKWAQILVSLVADTGPEAVARRLAFWAAARESAAREFWTPLRATCDTRALQLAVALQAENGASLEVRWGQNLGRFADSVAVVAGDSAKDVAQVLRAQSSRAALEGKDSPSLFCAKYVDAALAGEAFIAGAARIGESFDATRSVSATRARNEYHARIGEFAAMKNAARVALVSPRRSLLAHYNPRAHRYVRWVEDDFRRATEHLQTLHFDYLVLDEDEIESAIIAAATDNDQAALLCGQSRHRIEMVVLPSVTTMRRAAWAQLERFIAAGGKVVCLGLLPRWSERGRDAEFEAQIGRATMLVVADLYEAYARADGGAPSEIVTDEISGVGYPVARSNDAGGRLSCYQPFLNRDAEDARLRVRGLLRDSLAPDFESQSAQLACARRTDEDGEWWLLASHSEHATRASLRLNVALPGTPNYALLHFDGLNPLREWMTLSELEGDGLVVPLDMAGGEIRALCWQKIGAPYSVERANFCVQSVHENSIVGYALQSGVPFATWQQGETLKTREGERVTIPAPILLENGQQDAASTTFRTFIPASWFSCRVYFEMAPPDAPVEISVGGESVGFLVAPPWKLDVTGFCPPGETEIRIVGATEIVARLAAYPVIEIAR